MTTIEKWITLDTEVKYEKIADTEFDFLLNVIMRSGDNIRVGKSKKYPRYIHFLGIIQIPEELQKGLDNLTPAQRNRVIKNLEIEVDRLQPDGQTWTKPYTLILERRLPITNDLNEDIFLKMLGRMDTEKGLLKKIFIRDIKKEIDENLPNLYGRIILSKKIMSPNEKDLGFLLSVYIWNSGADSAIRGYWAEVAFGDEVFVLDPYVLPEKGITLSDDQGNPTRTFTSSDALELKTLNPIKKGDVMTGVLLFIIKDGIRFKDMKSKWKLFFRDYLGRVSGVYAEFGKQVEPDVVIPGATGSEPKKKTE